MGGGKRSKKWCRKCVRCVRPSEVNVSCSACVCMQVGAGIQGGKHPHLRVADQAKIIYDQSYSQSSGPAAPTWQLLRQCMLTLSFLQMLQSGMAPSKPWGSLQMSPSDQKSSTWVHSRRDGVHYWRW